MAEEATKDTPEMSEAEAGKAIMDSLSGVSEDTTETEGEQAEETQGEGEDKAEDSEQDSEENQEEENAEKEETSVKDEKSIFSDLKALAGRVPSLQKENAQNKNEISRLNETVSQLRELLTPKKETQAEGLIDKLVSDNGEDFLNNKIKEVVQNLYGAEIEAQRANRERMGYYQRLQDLSGKDWDKIEPAATAVMQELAEAKEKGEPWANDVLSAIENPLTLKLLAERHIALNADNKAKMLKEKRKETSKRVSGTSPSSPREETGVTEKDIKNMKPAEAEAKLRELLKGDGRDILVNGL